MSQQTVTLTLSEAELQTIDEIAANMEVDRAAVLRDMLEAYLASYAQEKAEAEEAEQDVREGRCFTQDEMEARFEARIRRSEAA